jgi:hypothetical protein
VVPTLRNLARIAMVFSKDLSYFFESEPHGDVQGAPAEGPGAVAADREWSRLHTTFESLGYMVPDRHMDPYFAEFMPLTGETWNRRRTCTRGLSSCMCCNGELDLRHGEHQCKLADWRRGLFRRGDSRTRINARAGGRRGRSL